MKVLRESAARIPQIIKENIKDRNVVFVFATSIQLNSWAEWCVKNPEETGVRAVAMDRFLAWDTFKGNFAVASQNGKKAIPSILREFFVLDFIQRNGELAEKGEPLLKKLIVPEYAKDAKSFASSISSLISMLQKWKERFDQYRKENADYVMDDEDRDYLTLYTEYFNFLGDEFFEPAWVTPDFSSTDKKFILFYPDQLLDFSEYEDLFKDNDAITILRFPLEKKFRQKVRVFSDSRKELRRTVLKIRNIVETSEGNVGYDDIALHVCNLDSIRPYIEREFEKYRVPIVLRKGESLLINNAGAVFSQISECVESNFSYEKMRGLLLNSYIPWNNKEMNESLIRIGNELHVICNYEEGDENDQWVKALCRLPQYKNELDHYKKLRYAMKKLCRCESFEKIKSSWFDFKRSFLNEEWSDKANMILGRCISELDSLIQIEREYVEEKHLTILDPYGFFLDVLKNKLYSPQQKISGVSVFDYKVACGSAYKYNFLFNSSQKGLSVTYRPMSFLNSQKRKALGFFDSDVSTEVFIDLYGRNNSELEEKDFFTCAVNSFDGFSIPHSYLEEWKEEGEKKGSGAWWQLDEDDFILNEQKYFLSMENGCNKKEVVHSLSSRQVEEFNHWKNSADYSVNKKQDYEVSFELKEQIDEVLKIKRSQENKNIGNVGYLVEENERARTDASKVKVTQSDLEGYFECPRNWLFKNVLKLREETLDTDLFTSYDQGNINHKALEILLGKFEESKEKIPCSDDNGSFGQKEEEMKLLVKESVWQAIHSREMNFSHSPLVLEVLESQAEGFEKVLMSFLSAFCGKDVKGKAGGLSVVSREKWYSAHNAEKDYVYSGKIDLLLKDDDGNVYIIDYKNRAVPSAVSCRKCEVEDGSSGKQYEELRNFQCAMYVLLWNMNNDDVNSASGMAFESIAEGKTSSVFWNKEDGKSYDDSVKVLTTYTDIFNRAALNYEFSPKAFCNDADVFHYTKVDVFESCINCKYKNICRTTYTVGQQKL